MEYKHSIWLLLELRYPARRVSKYTQYAHVSIMQATYQVDLVKVHLHLALLLNHVRSCGPIHCRFSAILKFIIDGSIQHDLIRIGTKWVDLFRKVCSVRNLFPQALADS